MAGLKRIEGLALTFHDIFYELSGILCPWDKLSLSKIVKTILIFGEFFYLTRFNKHKLLFSPKSVSFALFSFSSLPYFVLALTFAVTNLPLTHRSILRDFPRPTIDDDDYPGLENN